ncbi:MAG: YicC/YloC family endoribonuclease, partial [Planctomycetota bacterium]
MTGYGRGSSENRYAAASVELRSVNGKGLSIKLRLPHDRLELESKIEGQVRRGLERGSVQGQVRVRLLEVPVAELDLKVLRRYLAAWRKAEKELGLAITDPSMAELLALPGAQHGVEESTAITRGVAKAVTEATKAALEALTESRAQEGTRLAKEMMR